MKIARFHARYSLLLPMLATSLIAIASPVTGTVYSDVTGTHINNIDTHYRLAADTAINPPQDNPNQQQQYERKHVLNDEPKDLSGFFIIGIAVNLLMAIAFAWWFIHEWRRKKK